MSSPPPKLTPREIVKILKKEMKAVTYPILVNPDKWVLPNRAKFPTWVDSTFKYGKQKVDARDDEFKSLKSQQHFVKDYMQFESPYRGLYLFHGLGVGKCHGKDTQILMKDGNIKMVQDIVMGDIVMGDDSTPRKVISTCTGKDDLYDITHPNGEFFSVNTEHILCLKDNEQIIREISTKEYIRKNLSWKSYKSDIIEFEARDTLGFDPYTFGLWLGDEYNTYDKSLILGSLVESIPIYMKINTIYVRFLVLAGLIDACTSLNTQTGSSHYLILVFSKEIGKDIIFISRSLGINAKYISNTIISLSGSNITKIPVKCVPKAQSSNSPETSYSFEIKYRGYGEYYGFMLDGNHRYVLGDFSITHNSAASIASAEILMNHMDVIVMLPASLRPNFINEVKQFGRTFFNVNNYWVHLTYDDIEGIIDDICEALSLPIPQATKHFKEKGLWMPLKSKQADVKKFSTDEKQRIVQGVNAQSDFIIDNKYTFVNYNGLSEAKVQALTGMFENKCIIIDEIHNLLTTLVNKGARSIAGKLYTKLMNTQYCKIIALSGTPIQNEPFEIAFLMNLLSGKKKYYELSFIKKSMDKEKADEFEKYLEENPYIDFYTFNRHAKTASFNFLPPGFTHAKGEIQVKRESDDTNLTSDQILSNLQEDITEKIQIEIKNTNEYSFTTLPEEEQAFNKLFISEFGDDIINEKLFMRRILGSISYFHAYDKTDYPERKDLEVVRVNMSTHQFSMYIKARIIERKSEQKKQQKSNKKSGDGGGQVYKVYSRANCNFSFPDNIPRPYISHMKEDKHDEEDVDNLGKKQEEHVKTAIKNILKGGYLSRDKLHRYSPKFSQLLTNLDDGLGKSLVYSQFNTLEGMGLFKHALDEAGYVELKIKKSLGEWAFLKLSDEDKLKPKYFQYRNSDDSEILLKLFNSDTKNIPESLHNSLSNVASESMLHKHKIQNIYGDILKIILITKSGSEGISLKHVRFVHILEPYWNQIRVNQVIGRAVRTNSHDGLPQSEKTVESFIYLSVFNEDQKRETEVDPDYGLTTDEHIYNGALKKENLNNKFLELLKRASVDCALHGKQHDPEKLECFKYPMNLNEDEVMVKNNIDDEFVDNQFIDFIKNEMFRGTLYLTTRGNFLVRNEEPGKDDVYDYDIYLLHKKLVKLGKMKIEFVDGKKKYIIS